VCGDRLGRLLWSHDMDHPAGAADDPPPDDYLPLAFAREAAR
jgi:hypothetical protein